MHIHMKLLRDISFKILILTNVNHSINFKFFFKYENVNLNNFIYISFLF